jgi:hypothetical protein
MPLSALALIVVKAAPTQRRDAAEPWSVVAPNDSGAQRAPHARRLVAEPKLRKSAHRVEIEAARGGPGTGQVGVTLALRRHAAGAGVRVGRDQEDLHRLIVPSPAPRGCQSPHRYPVNVRASLSSVRIYGTHGASGAARLGSSRAAPDRQDMGFLPDGASRWESRRPGRDGRRRVTYSASSAVGKISPRGAARRAAADSDSDSDSDRIPMTGAVSRS